jgi:hypothetical protein
MHTLITWWFVEYRKKPTDQYLPERDSTAGEGFRFWQRLESRSRTLIVLWLSILLFFD